MGLRAYSAVTLSALVTLAPFGTWAQASLDEVRSAPSIQALFDLGGHLATADEFRSLVFGKELDEGTWVWFVNPDGSHSSRAKDGSWEDRGGSWEFQGNKYCRNTVAKPQMNCSDVYIVGNIMRLTNPAGELLPWVVTIPEVTSSSVHAAPVVDLSWEQFAGLYKPAGSLLATGQVWTCNPAHVGSDGGALAIQDGVLLGVENRCDLTDPKPGPEPSSVTFSGLCAAEGDTYTEAITLIRRRTGIDLIRDSFRISWDRCGPQQSSAQYGVTGAEGWTASRYGDQHERGVEDESGNAVVFTCREPGEHGGLYVQLGGQPVTGGDVEFDIDGKSVSMTAWSYGGWLNTDCRVCAANYTALWEMIGAGSTMTVRSADGSAEFSLRGSRTTLGEESCVPEGDTY